MGLSRTIARHTLIHAGGKLVSMLVGLGVLMLTTRALGVAGYGTYTAVIGWVQAFAILADFGLTLTTLQMISGTSPEEEARIFGNALGLRFALSVAAFLLAPLLLFFLGINGEMLVGVTLACVAYFFLSLHGLLTTLFQKNLAMEWAALADIFGRVVMLAGTWLVFARGGGLVGVLVAMILGNAVTALIFTIAGARYVRVRVLWDLAAWRAILWRSWPIGVTTILNLVYLRGDVVALSFFGDDVALGYYGTAYRVLDVFTVLPVLFMGLVLPPFTAAWKQGDGALVERVLSKSWQAMLLVSMPLVCGGLLVAPFLMRLFGGDDFVPGSRVLRVLLPSLVLVFLSSLFTHAVIALEAQRRVMLGFALAAVLGVACYVTLIPVLGALGAAIGTLASELVILLYAWVVVRRATGWRVPVRESFLIVLCAGVMSVAVWLVRDFGLAASVLTGAITYAAAVFSLGLIPRELVWRT